MRPLLARPSAPEHSRSCSAWSRSGLERVAGTARAGDQVCVGDPQVFDQRCPDDEFRASRPEVLGIIFAAWRTFPR